MAFEPDINIPSGTERIAKKEYLNNKHVRRVTIPESVKEVGDWAFAYCDNLKEVEFSPGIVFGREVFKGCGMLRNLLVRGKDPSFGALLCAVRDVPYLMAPEEIGTPEWIQKWDAYMMTTVHLPDDEGYSNQIMCGEEDFASTDLEGYKKASRMKKIRLILLRLLCSEGLSKAAEEEIRSYVLSHTKGSPGGEETWELILNEYGDDREYYELFAKIGCLNTENYKDILDDIRGRHTEMKAYFIRFMDDLNKVESGDFFSNLMI